MSSEEMTRYVDKKSRILIDSWEYLTSGHSVTKEHSNKYCDRVTAGHALEVQEEGSHHLVDYSALDYSSPSSGRICTFNICLIVHLWTHKTRVIDPKGLLRKKHIINNGLILLTVHLHFLQESLNSMHQLEPWLSPCFLLSNWALGRCNSELSTCTGNLGFSQRTWGNTT